MKPDEKHPIVWLFDIDGTLIRAGGAGGLALASALQECFGVPPEINGVEFAGRTDRAITQDLFTAHEIEPNDANFKMLLEAYQQKLPNAMELCQGEVLAGAVAWLDHIAESGGHLGLLTGNMFSTAKIKLEHFGLWDYFSFGGYGDHHLERNDVAADAMVSATESLGFSVDSSSVWVVGDTPNDVFCGKSQGFNVLSVATGGHSSDELLTHTPNIVLQSLHEVAPLVRIIGRQG